MKEFIIIIIMLILMGLFFYYLEWLEWRFNKEIEEFKKKGGK